jgi:Flp pilus assembly protein TadD
MIDQDIQAVQLLALACLQQSRPEKAALLLDALDALQPGRREVLRALALAQLRSGEPQRALDTLERVAVSSAADPAFHLLRSQALLACDRRIEGGAAMSTCLALRRARSFTDPGGPRTETTDP